MKPNISGRVIACTTSRCQHFVPKTIAICLTSGLASSSLLSQSAAGGVSVAACACCIGSATADAAAGAGKISASATADADEKLGLGRRGGDREGVLTGGDRGDVLSGGDRGGVLSGGNRGGDRTSKPTLPRGRLRIAALRRSWNISILSCSDAPAYINDLWSDAILAEGAAASPSAGAACLACLDGGGLRPRLPPLPWVSSPPRSRTSSTSTGCIMATAAAAKGGEMTRKLEPLNVTQIEDDSEPPTQSFYVALGSGLPPGSAGGGGSSGKKGERRVGRHLFHNNLYVFSTVAILAQGTNWAYASEVLWLGSTPAL